MSEENKDNVVVVEENIIEKQQQEANNTDANTETEKENQNGGLDKIKQGLTQGNKEAEPKDKETNASKPENAEIETLKKEKADLLKEVMAKKEKIKTLEETLNGVDPAVIKDLLAKQKEAEEKARKDEQERLEKENNWEALKKQIVEENQKTIGDLNAQIESLKKEVENNKKEKETLFINSKFEESKYIKENLILTPSKTKIIYGSYFDLEDGQMVAYNAPKGSTQRMRLVDGNGNNLDFDRALAKIVDTDPDKDTILRSKVRAGANSRINSGENQPNIPVQLSALEKITKGLENSGK